MACYRYVLLIGCQKDDQLTIGDADEPSTNEKSYRDEEAVINEIQLFLDAFDDDAHITRSGNTLRIKNINGVYKNPDTRSPENNPLYYVVNMDDDGVCIVSADKDAEPIMAYIDEGEYEGEYYPGEDSGVPAFDFFIEIMEDYLTQIAAGPIGPISPIGPIPEPIWPGEPLKPIGPNDFVRTVYGPWTVRESWGTVLPVKWDQGPATPTGDVYNAYCPVINGNMLTPVAVRLPWPK